MDPETRKRIQANLFPGAWSAIDRWDEFPWHRDRSGKPDTWKLHSSQALAIDVFGTLKASPQVERNSILNAIARSLEVAESESWSVELEWSDSENRLLEPRRTQVDAMARSPQSLILFEAKFTEEGGGSCSQPKPLLRSDGRVIQCNGSYSMQINPANGIHSRCALSGKGIRYWELVPQLFRWDAAEDHSPCPFACGTFQWMRNLALAHAVCAPSLRAAFVIVYADSPKLAFTSYLKSTEWQDFKASLLPGRIVLTALSFQSLLETASNDVGPGGNSLWHDLKDWVNAKIASAEERPQKPR